MVVKKISIGDDAICFEFDTDVQEIKIKAFSPAIREHIELGTYDAETEGCRVYIPRYAFGRDGLYLAYELYHRGEKLTGKSYAEEFTMTPENDYPYPPADTKKGLQINPAMIDDAISIGARHCAYNVCIGDLMQTEPEGCILFRHDGRDYYFDSEAVASCDRSIKQMSDVGITVTLILLCTKNWPLATPEDMYGVLLHPDYVNDRENEGGLLSGFNVITDEGIRHYAAFIAFLTKRYTDTSQEHGRAVGMIISNEVNSHWVWNNSGHKNAEEIAREYTTALRIACQASVEVYKNMRIYASLDHFWTGALNTREKEKYTGSRYLLENLSENANADGDFHWNVAFHPYPENLSFPDFWNDKTATEDNDTCRVTFKNLGVLCDFLYREENLYKGQRRRIILSEQGFNSSWTPESEILQACAYGRAYRAVMEIPEIDSFIYHAHGDNAGEGGSLNLGLWRRNKDKPGFDAPKPIYYVFKAIDQCDETGRCHWERY
ncbi:hypothetical protein SAMN02745136_05610 [Anaerocolumna jejuensis DSM 15929]|uniref:DUF5722 domain-containing protein n=1 Tax=Anaerocolumna jejuensis DSM 15929 TaxID=1121322 RepID=A0A1M7D5F9_9FIRM|nr:DUF5722 domain-containing protein [Anaerocolumna jejuensis]SHL74637.1 hypothetical protein SAMN02745136_05610 [Anaerocolumna jejuensis DSM 15929]